MSKHEPISFDSLWASTKTWEDFIRILEDQGFLSRENKQVSLETVTRKSTINTIMGVKTETKTYMPYGILFMVYQGQIVSTIYLTKKEKK